MTMTLPSQFSLEEENFYKDIQDLVKKGTKNEKELCMFLERYMDLLARADLDDETFIINFTKAGLIIEASAKVYGTKVDKLWINLEHVLESLKNKGNANKKKPDCEDDGGEYLDTEVDEQGEGRKKVSNARGRRKKLGDALFSSDDFLEIDNVTGLLGKSMNETKNNSVNKIKFCEKVPYMFIKSKAKKKRMDVCLNRCVEDKDFIRLRDWVITSDCLLVREIYTPLSETSVYTANSMNREVMDASFNSEECKNDENDATFDDDLRMAETQGNLALSSSLKEEKNNNVEANLESSVKNQTIEDENIRGVEGKESLLDELNISKESVLEKFPNVMDRLSGDCLVDVDEVFWNSPKFEDVIPTKKMRPGKTNKNACSLCADKKEHKRKSKKCLETEKIGFLDSYFEPHVEPILSIPHSGILPDKELYNAFKIEMKLIEQLGKVENQKNLNEAYNTDESSEDVRNFLGFDGFENYLMKKQPVLLDDDDLLEENYLDDRLEDDNENCVENPVPEKDFVVPFPVTETSFKTNVHFEENDPELKTSEFLAKSNSDYQQLVSEKLKDHYAAKSTFAKNKELGMRISKWHEKIADKIKLCQKRGALNMNVLAEKIMRGFPSCENGERSVMPFKDLVKKQCLRDIPRYFFACLQLTNEGNLDISKSSSVPLATDCMVLTQLRTARANCELEDSPTKNSSRDSNHSKASQTKRKRESASRSPTSFNSKDDNRKKKLKGNSSKPHKRQNSITSVKKSKRRKSSTLSSDSVSSE